VFVHDNAFHRLSNANIPYLGAAIRELSIALWNKGVLRYKINY